MLFYYLAIRCEGVKMKLNKKIMIMSAATLALSNVMAMDYYVGAMGGVSFLDINQQYTSVEPTTLNPVTGLRQFNATAPLANVYAGVALNHKRLHLGLEGIVGSNFAKSSQSIHDVQGVSGANIKVTQGMNGFVGLALMPGINISNNNLLYLRAGFVGANFSTKSSSHIPLDTTKNDAWYLGYTGSKSHFALGYQLGVGVESYFSQRLSMRLEYSYMQFSPFKYHQDGTYLWNMPATFTYKPHASNIMLGVTYHFGGGGYTAKNNVVLPAMDEQSSDANSVKSLY